MRTLLCALFILCAACASDAPVSDYDPHTKTTRHISTIQTKLIPGLAQTQAAAMIGHYKMMNFATNTFFNVEIPTFNLSAPFALN